MIGSENPEVVARFVLRDFRHDLAHRLLIDLSFFEAEAEELTGGALGFFADFHGNPLTAYLSKFRKIFNLFYLPSTLSATNNLYVPHMSHLTMFVYTPSIQQDYLPYLQNLFVFQLLI